MRTTTPSLRVFNPFFLRVWGEAATSGPIAIVSHGGPVRVMLEKLGALPDALWHYRRQCDHQNPLPPAGRVAHQQRWCAGVPWQMDLQFAPGAIVPYAPQTVAV
jgi:hypothetical protein